ncbi:MAG: general secretion pathway protein GspK, partial [Candidatus Omnitrophica bacterium]|nr:general secretion pathway protein GspK [Candidatus Omnitrophota bacterium]
TSAMAASILDWRDKDNQVTPGGAEEDYYAERTPPYEPRNGPFQTLGELLQVKGFTPSLLLGEDVNMDGVLQTAEDDGAENDPPDDGDGTLDQGLGAYLTLYSYDLNQNPAGEKRLNINSASEETLRARLEGKVSEESVKKILAYKKDNQIDSLAQLLTGKPSEKKKETEEQTTDGKEPQSRPIGESSGGANKSEGGSRKIGTTSKPIGREEEEKPETEVDTSGALVTKDEFTAIVDELTTSDEERLPGLVNINTAPREVLMGLPGMTENLADAILGRRGADGQAFTSVGELVSLEGMNLDTLAEMLPHMTVRSYVFEARAVGYVPATKAYAAIYAILDRGGGENKFLNYRVLR